MILSDKPRASQSSINAAMAWSKLYPTASIPSRMFRLLWSACMSQTPAAHRLLAIKQSQHTYPVGNGRLCPHPSLARKNETHAAVEDYFLVGFPADPACLRRLVSVSFIRFKTALCLEDLAKLVYSLGSLSRSYNSAASAAPHSA